MKIYKYKDNVDTDVIIPARYLNSFDAKELASHAMAEREHAPLFKTAGIKCVIAKSFAFFYRNSINIGFPLWNVKKQLIKLKKVTK